MGLTRNAFRMTRAALVAAALAGCVGPTPYAPAKTAGGQGFAETLLEPGVYRVRFTGNSVTSQADVETALLLRAAELTLREGGDWFLVIDSGTEADIRRVTVVSHPDDYPYGFYGYGYRGFGSVETREYTRYRAEADIMVMRGAQPAGQAAAHDAKAVAAALGPIVPRPDPE